MEEGSTVNTRTLRRARKQIASTLDDVIDNIEEVSGALEEKAEKAGGETRAELAALHERLDGLRGAVVAALEPYRPPKRYRPYAQLGVLVVVAAAAIAIVVRRRLAARHAATIPDRAADQPSSGDDGRHRPTPEAGEEAPEFQGRGG